MALENAHESAPAANHIHFVGVGGIGVSALARMMHVQGKEVSGSDAAPSPLLDDLAREGISVCVGHRARQVIGADMVVYSTAVPDDNPELTTARRRGIPTLTRAAFLGHISRGYRTVAVSGTHGKTTTTAMITGVLRVADLDPTAFVGSLISHEGQRTNVIVGSGKYLVAEACEYRRSFLELHPAFLIITNIEEDHLDYFKDLPDIQNAFRSLALMVPEDGAVICRASDAAVSPVIEGVPARVIDYALTPTDGLALRVPGAHNMRNAQAALAAADALGVGRSVAVMALNAFSGASRRFEYRGTMITGARVYDDYAHHPSEIRATLAGARELFPASRIVAVFQPHLYSRTKDFLVPFAASFNDADTVIITDIYAAREKDDGSIHARDLVHEIKKVSRVKSPRVSYRENFTAVADDLTKNTATDDVIVVMGAGDVGDICGMIL